MTRFVRGGRERLVIDLPPAVIAKFDAVAQRGGRVRAAAAAERLLEAIAVDSEDTLAEIVGRDSAT